MVGVMVVRTSALVSGERVSCFLSSGSKSQRLAKASLFVQDISGPRNSNISRVGSLSRVGKGRTSSLWSARLITVIAVCAGGAEL